MMTNFFSALKRILFAGVFILGITGACLAEGYSNAGELNLDAGETPASSVPFAVRLILLIVAGAVLIGKLMVKKNNKRAKRNANAWDYTKRR